jgi:hypothetical protein
VTLAVGILAAETWNLDQDQADYIIIGLLAALAIALVFVIRAITKTSTRIVLSVAILALAGGLWWQHEELQDCESQCECRLFGRDLEIPDPDVICPGVD